MFKVLVLSLCLPQFIPNMAAEEVGSLESYPEVNRIWMGLEEGTIRPAAYEQVRSGMAGYLSLVSENGQLLEKNELWAVFDPEHIDLERSGLELEERKLALKMDDTIESQHELQLSLALDIHEAESKMRALKDASEDPSVPTDLRQRAGEAIEKMAERLDLLRKKADPESLKRDLKLEEDEGNLLIARKRKEFLALEKRSHLLAPFAGKLRLSDSLEKAVLERKEKDALLWVDASQHLATIVDDSKFEIVVKATGPVLSQVPREDLLVFLQEPKTGRLIEGVYARIDEVDSGGEITQNYVFTIQGESLGDARHSSGQRGLVYIYRKFESPVRLIHKKDIAFAASEVLSNSGWNGVVTSLWPGSRVIQVAPQTIAVMPKDDN